MRYNLLYHILNCQGTITGGNGYVDSLIIISYSKLSGNYNLMRYDKVYGFIISYSKLSGNYNITPLNKTFKSLKISLIFDKISL